MKENIYLLGFMGSGKSTVGLLLAQRLNRCFVDLDQELEKSFKMTISDFFAKYGEEMFRSRESAMLENMARKERLVIATGGGIIERSDNRKLMRKLGRTVYLNICWESLNKRMTSGQQETRPLWSNPEEVQERFQRRLSLYEDAELNIAVENVPAADNALKIQQALFPDFSFVASLEEKKCPVTCSCDAPTLLREQKTRKVLVLTDPRVEKHQMTRYLDLPGERHTMVLRGGEGIKCMPTSKRIYKYLIDHHFNRDDLLVAVGGGTVTDLGAYIAATYKRGMRFSLISTSLLGCVDAAVGGKSAINIGQAKNVVGCFTIPEQVLLDTQALLTLPVAQIREGLIEAYKTGVIADADFATFIEENLSALLQKDGPLLAYVAQRSAELKGEVVSEDFRESGRRAILNFGHTYGHAVEGFHRYKVSHGRSVALGMLVAAQLSADRRLLNDEQLERVNTTLHKIMPRMPSAPPPGDAAEIMQHDKKIRDGKIVFVLLKGIGDTKIVNDLETEELNRAVAAVVK